MLFIGNLLGRIWGFFVVRPAMKKAINDADDFDEYKTHMDALDANMEDLLASTKRAQEMAKLMNKSKKQAEITRKSMEKDK